MPRQKKGKFKIKNLSSKTSLLKVNTFDVELMRKNIKHLYLRVYPPNGQVRVSAPRAMSIASIRLFIDSRSGWIKNQQDKCRAEIYEVSREYADGEVHYFNGKQFLLEVIEHDAKPRVDIFQLNGSQAKLLLRIRPGADKLEKQALLEAWYRERLEERLSELLTHWENIMGVSVAKVSLRKMKSRWGSCTPGSRTIRINLELARKSPRCLEYILVHELAHLLEPAHNRNFYAIMDKFLPSWRQCREELNAPLGESTQG